METKHIGHHVWSRTQHHQLRSSIEGALVTAVFGALSALEALCDKLHYINWHWHHISDTRCDSPNLFCHSIKYAASLRLVHINIYSLNRPYFGNTFRQLKGRNKIINARCISSNQSHFITTSTLNFLHRNRNSDEHSGKMLKYDVIVTSSWTAFQRNRPSNRGWNARHSSSERQHLSCHSLSCWRTEPMTRWMLSSFSSSQRPISSFSWCSK